MYDDLFNELLHEAETLYGKRNADFIIDGVEITSNNQPDIYFPYNDNRVIIRITEICRNNKDFATFQIAHEVIHCLYPNLVEDVTYLEEGLATFFQTQVSNIQIESGATKYITARELASKLLEFDNNIIKAAREVEPNISKISKDLLAKFYSGDDEELLDRITAPFYY